MAGKLALALVIACSCSVAAAEPPATAPPLPAASDSASAARAEFFERRVRPVLAERCVGCHGPGKQQGGLRLDSRAGLLAGGDGGAVVNLDRPGESRLLKAIGYLDDDLRMPPETEGRLPGAAVADLAAWLEAGAFWPTDPNSPARTAAERAAHWSFRPIGRPAIPAVRDAAWPVTPIDAFILARLEASNLAPSPSAGRAALLRRASFDLIGLAPSEEESRAFELDQSPDAFARAVDRLLASPHYGERWGRYWLDVARYADTKGYVRLQEERQFHYAFTYRDWVIRSLNEDLPFDRFVTEQLAADHLTGDRKRLAALGFLTLGRRFTSNEHDVIDDRIDVVTRGLLGLTVSCARCHDHKYDPIPTADYYSLYGVFASSEDPTLPELLQPPGVQDGDLAGELRKRQQALDDYEPQQYQTLLNEFRARAGDYLVKALEGRAPPQQPLPMDKDALRQVVVERWIDYLEQAGRDDAVFGPWHGLAALDSGRFATEARSLVAGWAAETGATIDDEVKRYFVAHPPSSMIEVARGYGRPLAAAHQRLQQSASSSLGPAAVAVDLSDPLARVLYAADGPVAVSRQEALWQYLYDAQVNEEIMRRRNAINQHLAQTATAPPRAHTLEERPLPREPRVFVRGNPTRPGRRVPRQFLAALSPPERQPFAHAGGRLDLARAIANRDNPLFARVIVNRVWAHHFGVGLVSTTSNFGSRGQPPSHPELLDYLARRFMDEGWSIKRLHRLILSSSVYQQASQSVLGGAGSEVQQRASALDPENRLLWRFPRRRLDFEALRDALLSAAGRLDRSMGGPSVDLASSECARRSVYGLIDRQGLPGMLPTFDFASPDAHSPERYTTTVPQQALFLMNSPLAIKLAQALAARDDVRAIDDPARRVGRLIALAWGREPSAEETRLSLEFIERERADAATDAWKPWEALAQALLLANEFSYVD